MADTSSTVCDQLLLTPTQIAATVSTVCEQLPAAWATLCRSKQSTSFAWAHDGDKASGSWVELRPEGHLVTKWGTGSWERDDAEPVVLKLSFGSSCHFCHLLVDEGKFQVEKSILRRGGQLAPNPKVKGVEVVSAGWPIEQKANASESKQKGTHEGKQKPIASAEKIFRAKLKAAEVAEEKKKAAEEAASEAAQAAAAAAANAKEMEKLAAKAEAARSKAAELAEQARKEAEGALAEREAAGLGRFGFATPQAKRTQDAGANGEDSSVSAQKPAKRAKEAIKEHSVASTEKLLEVLTEKTEQPKGRAKSQAKRAKAAIEEDGFEEESEVSPEKRAKVVEADNRSPFKDSSATQAWISNVEELFS